MAKKKKSMDDFGVTAVSYVITGILFWGLIGWVVEKIFHVQGLMIVGIVLGIIGSIYLVVKLDPDGKNKDTH